MAECYIGDCKAKAEVEANIYNLWRPYCIACVDKNRADWEDIDDRCWGGVRDLEEKPIYQDPPEAYLDKRATAALRNYMYFTRFGKWTCTTCNGKGTICKVLFNLMHDEPCGDCSGV